MEIQKYLARLGNNFKNLYLTLVNPENIPLAKETVFKITPAGYTNSKRPSDIGIDGKTYFGINLTNKKDTIINDIVLPVKNTQSLKKKDYYFKRHFVIKYHLFQNVY